MGLKIVTGVFASLALYAILAQYRQVSAAPGAPTNSEPGHRLRSRPFLRLAPRPISQYARVKPDLGDFIVDDDDIFELNKRQTSDDYGHLRFGKRDEFDDYGHMRFGRSGSTDSKK